MKDYYKILGIKRTATTKEIKSAYRNLVKKHHPDMTGNCEADEQIKDINEAYDTLMDPEKRKSYNQNLGQKIKVNVVKSKERDFGINRRRPGRPEPLIPRNRQPMDVADAFFEEQWRYFEKLRRYLLRRFFDDDFFF